MRRILALLLIALVMGCVSKPDKIWLYNYPVGCTDNIWQQEWVASHEMNFSAYPQNQDTEILKDSLKSRNITLLDFASKPYPIPQELADCTSCSCPRGDVYHILVSQQDVEKAKSVGFKEVPEEIYCEKDEDCVIVEDCCGCSKGGLRIPLNKNFKQKWEKQLQCEAKCPDWESTYPYCNQTLELKCAYNQCRLA